MIIIITTIINTPAEELRSYACCVWFTRALASVRIKIPLASTPFLFSRALSSSCDRCLQTSFDALWYTGQSPRCHSRVRARATLGDWWKTRERERLLFHLHNEWEREALVTFFPRINSVIFSSFKEMLRGRQGGMNQTVRLWKSDLWRW